jgi:hypothetical protein
MEPPPLALPASIHPSRRPASSKCKLHAKTISFLSKSCVSLRDINLTPLPRLYWSVHISRWSHRPEMRTAELNKAFASSLTGQSCIESNCNTINRTRNFLRSGSDIYNHPSLSGAMSCGSTNGLWQIGGFRRTRPAYYCKREEGAETSRLSLPRPRHYELCFGKRLCAYADVVVPFVHTIHKVMYMLN